jgi:hypothetical protein
MPESEPPPLDAEDWDIVFEAYTEYPILAFILAQHLAHLKELIKGERRGRAEALAAIDRAIESLMPHTNFRDAGRKVYLLAVAGELTHEQEEMIEKLDLTERE